MTEIRTTEEEESAVLVCRAERSTAQETRLDLGGGGDLPDLAPGVLAQPPLQVEEAAHLRGHH